MPKVQNSDLLGQSEKVKKLFTIFIDDRTIGWLKTQQYSNEDLISIYTIAKNIEKPSGSIEFYQRLIMSAQEPFDREVFSIFVESIYKGDVLIYLLKNTEGLNNVDKTRWIKHIIFALDTLPLDEVLKFILNGESKKYGIDILQAPYNEQAATLLIDMFAMAGKITTSKNKLTVFLALLDSMSDAKKMEFYHNTIEAYVEAFTATEILCAYQNTPEEMLTNFYYHLTDVGLKCKILTHKNCPESIKMDIYTTHGISTYLPAYLQELFVF